MLRFDWLDNKLTRYKCRGTVLMMIFSRTQLHTYFIKKTVGLELLYRECMFATMKTKRIVARDDLLEKKRTETDGRRTGKITVLTRKEEN